MIIRIQANGGSFRGAGLYYLHDKSDDPTLENHLKPKSDERVWFTDTRNCLSMDPGRALEEMWLTAEDQAYLKMHAGVKRGGRVCEDPVKTLSMSWHKDDRPTPEHMVEAADALMKHMGWNAHQAIYVGHNDTEHRHVHIVLNRVNPDTGRTLDDYREQKRAQSWALEYERSQDLVRCEQREINAAREAGVREQGQSEHPRANEPVHDNTRDVSPGVAPSQPVAANDHLPHNVIMLARPHEREFAAYEQLRQTHDANEHAALAAEQKADLKERQRLEREAFFKDGSQLFKATRHAVYDEVRQEYKAEWREFYKDSATSRDAAEASSATAIDRALHFARDGKWEAAREAFGDRDSVRDAVEKELAERKADLKSRQTDDLRERQRDACDALRDVRDVQYQALLQRQRNERAAVQAGQTLDALGIGTKLLGAEDRHQQPAANENQSDGVQSWRSSPTRAESAALSDNAQISGSVPTLDAGAQAKTYDAAFAQAARPDGATEILLSVAQSARADSGASVDLSTGIVPSGENQRAPAHGVCDLVAGGIGGTASYLADQLGELFAPTPPEVREAQVKAAAQQASEREAQKPEHDDKAAAYARLIDSAVRRAEAERAQKDDAYWKDRDRDKGWERDQ